jgi:hypothetical protein
MKDLEGGMVNAKTTLTPSWRFIALTTTAFFSLSVASPSSAERMAFAGLGLQWSGFPYRKTSKHLKP